MNVLRTIPFNEVNIKVFLIEVSIQYIVKMFPSIKNLEICSILMQTNKINITEMNQFMSSVGYDSTPVPPYDHMYIKR